MEIFDFGRKTRHHNRREHERHEDRERRRHHHHVEGRTEHGRIRRGWRLTRSGRLVRD